MQKRQSDGFTVGKMCVNLSEGKLFTGMWKFGQ